MATLPINPSAGGTAFPTIPNIGGASATTPNLVPGTGIGVAPTSGTLMPLTPATVIQAPSTGISTGLSTEGGGHTLVGDFQQTFGKGTGTALATTLAGLGSSTDAAVQATNNQILQSAGIQEANLRANLAASGLSPDSSASALELGDFASQVNTSLQSTDANMELSEYNKLIDSLFQEGTSHGSDTGFMDTFSNVIGAVGDVAGAVGEGFGVGGFAGKALDVLGAL